MRLLSSVLLVLALYSCPDLQAAQCTYSFVPSAAAFAAAGGSSNFTVTVTSGNNCNWTATSASSWIHTGSSGSGNGTVIYSVDANAGTTSRSGSIAVGGQNFSINQSGVPLTLAFALNNSNLVWQTASDFPWYGTNDVSHDGIASAASGNRFVGDSISWLETTVVGPGTVTFWWKVDSDVTPPPPDDPVSFDDLEFLVNGNATDRIMGQVGWNYRGFPIAPGTNTLTWQYVKDFQFNSGTDRAWLDQVTWLPGPPIALGDALDTCGVAWNSDGTIPTYWSGQTNITHDGKAAAQSGTIYLNQETWMETVVSGVSNVSFWWKVSSQTNFDFLEFYTNDVLARRISGEVNWQSNFFNLPVSGVTLRWRYAMTNGIYAPQGQETAWVDQVSFNPAISLPPMVHLLGAPVITNECHESFEDPGATAEDACSGVPLAVVTNGSVNPNITGEYILQYVATNASGAATTNSRIVEILDSASPQIVLNGAEPLIMECHGDFNDPGASAFDLCAGPLAVTTNGAPNPNVPGTYLIQYSATDPSGNSATNQRSVQVLDTTAPVILFAQTNLLLNAASNCQAILPDLSVSNYLVALDACSSVTVTQAPAAGAYLVIGTNVVTVTASDNSANSTNILYTVVVVDTTPPLIITPADLALSTDPGQCSVAHLTLQMPDVSDNCGIATITSNTPALYSVGSNWVTWTAVDIYGNSQTVTQTVVVSDLEAPGIVCPSNIATFADPGQAYASQVALGTPTLSDNCGIATLTNDAPVQFPLGTNVVLWIVVDVHGNSNSCVQQVIVSLPPNQPHGIASISNNHNGTLTLNFTGAANVEYAVQISSNLLGWQSIQTNLADANGAWNYTDSNILAFPRRFYRSYRP